MPIIINPGTGPVENPSRQLADENIKQFVIDLGLDCTIVPIDREPRTGRYPYTLIYNDKSAEITMPGIDLERVRYMGKRDQNIWDFPRLYVNGSSWVWCYALDMCFDEEEDF